MDASDAPSGSRKLTVFALIWSATFLAGGLILSLLTGEWIALLLASGLAILPVGVFRRRPR
jgi:hypothetical protein